MGLVYYVYSEICKFQAEAANNAAHSETTPFHSYREEMQLKHVDAYIHTPGEHGRIILFFSLAPNQPLYPSVYVLLWQNMSG